MASITKISLGGFKSIKDLRPLELRPANLLIGPNGACKSNLMSFLNFHDTSETAFIRKHGYVEDDRYLRSDAGNLAAFLYGLKLRQSPYYRRIIEAIRQVAPFFDDFVLVPKAETDRRSILLNWKDC